MQPIDVTVIVPCYNTADYLDQCLTSIEANSKVALEVIVVNDGSTDGSLSIMRAHAERDGRIRVIDKENQGYGASVNRGIDEARGAYVAIVEPDDYLKPGMFDSLFALGSSYGAPDIVKSSYWRVVMPGTAQERELHCLYYKRIKPAAQPFTLADCPNLIQYHPSIWSALYRRDFLNGEGIRFHEVPGAGWVDNPFLIDTMLRARSIVYTDKAFYCYREDAPGSSSANRLIPLSLERWNDMADIVEALGTTDAGVLRAFYTIGFNYVRHAVAAGAMDDPALAAQVKRIFMRMDHGVVGTVPALEPALAALYSELTGRASLGASKGAYLAAQAREFVYTVRANGLGFAVSRIGLFFERRKSVSEAAH